MQNFEVKADDLEPIVELGRGAYGVVEKMRHVPSGQIMAVKVELMFQKMGHVFSVCPCPSQLLAGSFHGSKIAHHRMKKDSVAISISLDL